MAAIEDIKDVVIIGGGSAGMSAALWCADLGIAAVIVEALPILGGQLGWIHNQVRNYPGRIFANGSEMRKAFEESIEDVECERRLSQTAVKVEAGTVFLSGDQKIEAKAVVIATGVRRRSLDVPGEEELFGNGILESGMKQRTSVAGKRVAVIGGGDAALENALLLSDLAERVYIIHRRESFRGRGEFIERARRHPKIEMRMNSMAERFAGETHLEEIHIQHGGSVEKIRIDHAIVRIGVQPNSEIAESLAAKDEQGYLIVDAQCRTSATGVWAIGDVANPVSPTIATAVGTGATCAKSIERFIRENE